MANTVAEKLDYLNSTKEAIKEAIIAKEGTITDDTTFREYAEEIEKFIVRKFGIALNDMLPDVYENSHLMNVPETIARLNLEGITGVNDYGLFGKFEAVQNQEVKIIAPDMTNLSGKYSLKRIAKNSGLTVVKFPKVASVNGREALAEAFYKTKITELLFPELTTVRGYLAFHKAAYYCKKLAKIDFSKVEEAADFSFCEAFVGTPMSQFLFSSLEYAYNDTFRSAFAYTLASDVDFSKLKRVGDYTFAKAFKGTPISSIVFDSLEDVASDCYNGQSFIQCFEECQKIRYVAFPALKKAHKLAFQNMFKKVEIDTSQIELHFPAGTETMVSQLEGYGDNFADSNNKNKVKIYFDL